MRELEIEFESFRYDINPIQYIMLQDMEHRHLWGRGGIGWGKSSGAVLHDLMLAAKYPGERGAVIIPTYPMCLDVVIPEYTKWVPESIRKFYNKVEHRLKLVNNHEIVFRPAQIKAQIEKLRGPTLRWCRLEEASLLPESVFDIMVGRLRSGDWQQMVGHCTPRGRDWIRLMIDKYTLVREEKQFSGHGKTFTVVRHRGKDIQTGEWDFMAYTKVASYINTLLPETYLHDLEMKYPGRFGRQEIWGEDVAMEGVVYDNFNPQIHILKKPKEEIKFSFIVIDVGFSTPTAILVFGLDGHDRLYVLDEVYSPRLTEDNISDYVRDFKEEYNTQFVLVDPSEAAFIQKLVLKGINAIGANHALIVGIMAVYSYLANEKLFVLEHCVNTITEFGLYCYGHKQIDRQSDKPIKNFDHCMDCVRYAVNWAAEFGSKGYSVMGYNFKW